MLALPALQIAAVWAALHGVPYGTTDDFLFERYIEAPLEDRSGPFGWKDQKAAELDHRSLEQEVIGGLRDTFREKLEVLLRALGEAGYRACINGGYRSIERQKMIESWPRATPGHSYHGGGPKHQGYGNGMAADLVSCFGITLKEREASSELIYQWIDRHSEYGFHRPYVAIDDPGHVSLVADGEWLGEAKHRHNHRLHLAHHKGRGHGHKTRIAAG